VVTVVVALVLTGCSGGSSGADESASTGDFCETFNGLVDKVLVTNDDDQGAMVQIVKDLAKELDEVGAPEGMPDDARRGLDLFVANAANLDDRMGLEDLQQLGAAASKDDRADALAFTRWTQENCPLT
jgi:hypothetical protein